MKNSFAALTLLTAILFSACQKQETLSIESETSQEVTTVQSLQLKTQLPPSAPCYVGADLDSDCDGVIDALDVCNGGDDTIDNNADGLPDCANPPAFADIIDEWKCHDGAKVIICHVPPGNPGNAHDICVSPSAIPAHMNHDDDNGNQNDGFSDYLGSCNAVTINIDCDPTGSGGGNGPDSDCDGISDACDVCPGGDDTIDNNADGLPDCANPPVFDDIIDAWKCGHDLHKVLICHVPPGNPDNAHTICVDESAIPAHMDHDDDNGKKNDGFSDYLGGCNVISCP